MREPVVHEVKSWPHLFRAFTTGVKQFDLRRADRDYRVGDILRLKEYDPSLPAYLGRTADALITYITSAENPCALSDVGLSEGYCILSLAMVNDSDWAQMYKDLEYFQKKMAVGLRIPSQYLTLSKD